MLFIKLTIFLRYHKLLIIVLLVICLYLISILFKTMQTILLNLVLLKFRYTNFKISNEIVKLLYLNICNLYL